MNQRGFTCTDLPCYYHKALPVRYAVGEMRQSLPMGLAKVEETGIRGNSERVFIKIVIGQIHAGEPV